MRPSNLIKGLPPLTFHNLLILDGVAIPRFPGEYIYLKAIMDTGMDEVEKFTCLIGPELMNNIMSYLSPRDIYSLGETIPEVKKIIYTNTAIQSAMF